MTVRINISIITLNVNRLNDPTKIYAVAEWIEKNIYAASKKHSMPCKWT